MSRVLAKPSKGKIIVKHKDFYEFFLRESYRTDIIKHFVENKTKAQYDFVCATKCECYRVVKIHNYEVF